MNILLLSVGTRNLIVRYFKRVVGEEGRVVAADMQRIAPAIYEADSRYIVPRISDERYIDIVLDICRKEKIDGVLSLIDPELSLLAENEERFREIGVTIIGSSYELCERALNKMAMFRWLRENGYRCALSYDNLNDFYADLRDGKIAYPVVVKPIYGSASIDVLIVHDSEMLEMLFARHKDLMIQEYFDGFEIGADCYIDMISGELVSIFTKKKLLMRSGETDKSISFKDEKLFELIERFCDDSGWKGQIDIDLFEKDGEYYFSEVNPRFGGGYPHAYMCGCDHMALIVNNLRSERNEKHIGCYEDGMYMMKYGDVSVRRIDTED